MTKKNGCLPPACQRPDAGRDVAVQFANRDQVIAILIGPSGKSIQQVVGKRAPFQPPGFNR